MHRSPTDYVGIKPKLVPSGRSFQDFVLRTDYPVTVLDEHGIATGTDDHCAWRRAWSWMCFLRIQSDVLVDSYIPSDVTRLEEDKIVCVFYLNLGEPTNAVA